MTAIIGKTRIAQWGNSKATRIPNNIVKQLHLKENQSLTITLKDNSIVLTPEEKQPKNIHELFANWQDDGQRAEELDWGTSSGHELEW
ncbi:AbrB/MazE/SpoVT family DNA-binding domain-containing protein [Lactobacillus sp. ESL0684]|uniref:AbrB/MazE/SpoVT family DNA-binding domain-containing protein n=1 Tax=unclassified Lactobacillus TaxID=2620435 RepID=UPI0023F77E31|nr:MULTISPECIES: AbrB/MazE/SpoVT family DNA-binding domain-containing protein [unclassified Lactobacillus]WEV39967.1 AbrB/MazE/SpoVT family DNA-binding domain-containing protein [Lactobacillus sp. ESL0681]WEV43491.1 AbrB/MazE/SpoVT family DNA-binding domain-containing protein [Lactobacillus sp. ESL0684]